eukprot:3320826-Prymnesium_polylepis.2
MGSHGVTWGHMGSYGVTWGHMGSYDDLSGLALVATPKEGHPSGGEGWRESAGLRKLLLGLGRRSQEAVGGKRGLQEGTAGPVDSSH